MRVRWGVRTGVVGEACVEAEACCRGEAVTLALFVWANRRSEDMMGYCYVAVDECRSGALLRTDEELMEEGLELCQAQIRRVYRVTISADVTIPRSQSIIGDECFWSVSTR